MVTQASRERLHQAKEVSLIGLIKELGGKLDETGGYYRMISPFRSESKASVDIDKRRPNKWTDRGTGKHGDVIDYVQELFSINKHDAIDYLLKRSNIPLPEYAPVKREQNSIEIITLQPLTETISPKLIDYLSQRKISEEVAFRWLKYATIKFPYSIKNPTREHHCLAWENDSLGFEFRNSFLKVSNSPKNITTIKGNSDVVSLYEGWPDYLTLLSNHKIIESSDTVIVLNSVSFLGSIIPIIKDKAIAYYGQNDRAGNDAFTRLSNECNRAVWDMRKTYAGYKDLNDQACGKLIPIKKSILFPKY